jgi:hypothetical protein
MQLLAGKSFAAEKLRFYGASHRKATGETPDWYRSSQVVSVPTSSEGRKIARKAAREKWSSKPK